MKIPHTSMKEKVSSARKELPEWIVTLMRAYREYTDTLEVEDAG